uniref:Protein transport protein Sec31A n=1 Tax=Oncorhynchus kisutch TaxID=8019 RepID=A0A8C7KK63_ONCKI
MRLKEIQRTAHPAWSPAPHHPICLALGTSAQQLDASFNTTAALEIFQVDFADPSLGMKLKGSLPTSNRLHSLVWVNFGAGEDGLGGRLIGGSDNGTVTVYSPEAIVTSGAEAIIGQSDKHTGPVRALDFNPFQSNLLASGANDSEIYIWDLNNFSNPMTPGTKSQPPEDISVVSWNRQVQHILASANPSGKAVVWDLRKNEPIIKISDHSNRMHCSGMLWHPEVATQLVLASEDDRMPVIQMWDLRFATSPLKVLENHTRGLLSIAWSQADPELLLSLMVSCGAYDASVVIYELPTTNQWCFDIQWCPRNPALLSAASFDGWISVYSVMGGSLEAQQQSRADQISSSFDTMDPFGTGQVLPPLQVPQPTPQTTLVAPLKKPPKWVRRPVGASFAFGGKLITFESPKAPVQSPQPVPVPRQVFVSQVTTETELLQRSRELQAALQSGSLSDYCQAKIHKAPTDSEQDIWRFLLVNFEDEARVKFLRLLGFSKEDLERKISTCLGKNLQPNGHGVDANDLAEKIQLLSTQVSPGTNLFILLYAPVVLDADGLISQALLVGNFEGAVDLCLNEGRYAEAILLAISGGQELLQKTQQTYLDEQRNSISMLISSVVTQNWGDIVQSCALENWKEALAALLTYAHPKEFAHLCETLGSRLEGERTEKRCLQACLCYICSGNIEKLVECWALQRDCSSPLVLEDLVEKMMVLRKSVERLRNSEVAVQSPILADKLTHYAGLLASQGSLATALSYLPDTSDQVNTTSHSSSDTLSTRTCFKCVLVFQRHCVFSLLDRVQTCNNYTPPAPITAPVMGGFPMEGHHHQPQGQQGHDPSHTQQFPPGAPQEPNVQVRDNLVCVSPCQFWSQNTVGFLVSGYQLVIGRPTSNPCVSLQLLQALPAERVEQREIPTEHMVLKQTFDSLVQRCQLAAQDPQTKRKLEDASKRLGYLYDKLREQTLSNNILGGLHEISRCVAGQNYQRGLEVHTAVVTSSNFSEIQAFMPILKVVMTIANKLGV